MAELHTPGLLLLILLDIISQVVIRTIGMKEPGLSFPISSYILEAPGGDLGSDNTPRLNTSKLAVYGDNLSQK